MREQTKKIIESGDVFLGIELGSTRIKSVLIGEDYAPIASGSFEWENELIDGVWTYSLTDVWKGLQNAYRYLADDVQNRYGTPLVTARAIGVSAMMHGYLVFDKQGKQLVPFRTWRNTTTEQAAVLLSEKFMFNIPLRWSAAHLYQAVLNREPHVRHIDFSTTLAGYVHWKLTGQKVLGVGDASGMFPIDSRTNDYNAEMAHTFNNLIDLRIEQIFPKVLTAGENAGTLTAEGAALLDPSGRLQAGIPFCPPEGDAGTGMVATNSVAVRTGNVSAGTSIFAMIVLENDLSKMYSEIDIVTTPDGKPVAMVHCNNCTTDVDAWIKLFGEVAGLFGASPTKADLYGALYMKALSAEADGGELTAYNFYAGEPIAALDEGRPLLIRKPSSRFTVANLMRTLLFSAMGTLRMGMDILTQQEKVRLEQMMGHGGLFKTKGVAQRLMAAALDVPITVMESAAEGGAWGIALLAAYRVQKEQDEPLEYYLSHKVFEQPNGITIEPDPADREGFAAFMRRYQKGLAVERTATMNL